MNFKLQHPQDLISRLFMLEYMRDLSAIAMYEKANKYQKELMFYKFTDEDDNEAVDFNWEYLLFVATSYELEALLQQFMEEIDAIEKKRRKDYDKLKQQIVQEQVSAPVDINLMDLAATEIKKNNEVKFE